RRVFRDSGFRHAHQGPAGSHAPQPVRTCDPIRNRQSGTFSAGKRAGRKSHVQHAGPDRQGPESATPLGARRRTSQREIAPESISRIGSMKAIGALAAAVAVILFAIYLLAWVALFAEHGTDAVRIGLTIWPGNVIGLGLLALSILFCITGWMA